MDSKCICGQTSRWRSWGWFWSKLRRLETGLSIFEFTAQWQGEGHPCTQSHPGFAQFILWYPQPSCCGMRVALHPILGYWRKSWGCLCLFWGWAELQPARAPLVPQHLQPSRRIRLCKRKKGKGGSCCTLVIQHRKHQAQSGALENLCLFCSCFPSRKGYWKFKAGICRVILSWF